MSQLLIGREYADVLIEQIASSQVSIKILAYDWRWYNTQIGTRIQKFNRAIAVACKRGVDVQVVLNSAVISHTLKNLGVKVHVVNASRKMHAKLIIIDEKLVLLGSHNLTISGFELNHEMSLVTTTPLVVSRCTDFFQKICHG